jgi:hypothetical protein
MSELQGQQLKWVFYQDGSTVWFPVKCSHATTGSTLFQ